MHVAMKSTSWPGWSVVLPGSVFRPLGQCAISGEEIPPFDWYRAHCLEGAREHRLPDRIVEEIAGWAVEIDARQARTPRR